jgi:hypothetical protein
MRKLTTTVCAVALGLGVVFNVAQAGKKAVNQGRPLSAELTGAAEVPEPGDPDGSGLAVITLNQGQKQVCFSIEVADIASPTAAHIHMGTSDVSGGVVVNLDIATNGLAGCVLAEAGTIKMIRQHPEEYYVNVHNGDFPPGALRGQLSKGF